MRKILIGFNPFVFPIVFENAVEYDLEIINGKSVQNLSSIITAVLSLLNINIVAHFNIIEMAMNSLKQSLIIMP